MIGASTTVFYETFWSFFPQYIVVQKLAITLFTSLLFQTLWPNWLNFFGSFKKIFSPWPQIQTQFHYIFQFQVRTQANSNPKLYDQHKPILYWRFRTLNDWLPISKVGSGQKKTFLGYSYPNFVFLSITLEPEMLESQSKTWKTRIIA